MSHGLPLARGKRMSTELIYKLDGIDPEMGVDVYEIAPVLMQFGNLVRAAADELDMGVDIDVRVKPFAEGSWIAQFVLHMGPIQSLLAYLGTPEGQSVEHLLALLFGIGVPAGVVAIGVTKVIRHVKGNVSRFTPGASGTFTYYDESDRGITVLGDVHTLIQSPTIQTTLYGSGMAPLDKFPGIDAVVIEARDGSQERITEHDREAFTQYAKSELAEEVEETITPVNGIYLHPHRGSYEGEGTRYTFINDGNSLWPVTITDEHLLADLKSAAIKFHGLDLIRVDMEWHQKKNAKTNAVSTRYVITRMVEYIPYRQPTQSSLLDEEAGDG